MKIILDTNFLMIPSKFNVDIFSEIDRIITKSYTLHFLDKSIDELKKIKGNKLALQLAEKLKIIKTKENLDVDSTLVKLSDKNTIIATNDKGLKQRLRKKKSKIITLKQKTHLVLQ